MKIRLVRSGGFAGMRREVTIDTETLDASSAEEIHEALEAADRAGLFRKTTTRQTTQHRDRFRYSLTIEDSKGKREARFSEENASESASLVVDAVWKAAGSADDPDSRRA
ncbi:MAG TPA: protealysin inhibitor emfourin [Thermoanaerobaculia bacterium]|nr:protealysin inhibitor emfourin [Thermoanaerobaculia bacterium]